MLHDKYRNSDKNLLKIRIIGQQCEIVHTGKIFSGEIMNETKNTWQIMTNTGLKIIPKNQSMLRIKFNDHLYEIAGNRVKGRHEDRIKIRMKRKW